MLTYKQLLICLICFSIYWTVNGQVDTSLFVFPSENIRNADDVLFNTNHLNNSQNTVVLILWKSCCKTSTFLLDELAETWADNELNNCDVYAVSVDDSRSLENAKVTVTFNDWPFIFLFDVNSDLKRALSLILEPTILIVSENKLIWKYVGFYSGISEEIMKIINSNNPTLN